MSARPVVLLVYPLPDSAGEDLLADAADVRYASSDDADALAAEIVDADAVILRGPARLTERIIAAAPRLRAIGTTGSGADYIDARAASRRRIPVVNTPGVTPRSIAEYSMSMIVATHRNFHHLHDDLVDGKVDWITRVSDYAGEGLEGTRLGIIGYGFIGKALAQMASAAYRVEVIAYDPYVDRGGDMGPARLVDRLDDLLEQSMTVCVHCPLTDETRGLVGARELDLLGPRGTIINAARGGIVDQEALIDALRSGRVKAAALDVFDPEPPTAEQLARLGATPNLFLTPHVAGATRQALRAVSTAVATGVLSALRGERPERVLNSEIYERS